MAAELTGLLVANLAYFLAGAGALAAIRALTWGRLGVAYLLGLVLVVIPASYVALLGVPVAATAVVVGLLLCGAGVWRTRAWRRLPRPPRLRRPGPHAVAGAAVAVLTFVLLGYAWRTFTTRPLMDWDAWVIWASKARLLYVDPSIAPAALRSGDYGQTPYPLGIPTLQALGFGAMGQFDGTLIGVQFLLLAFGFPLALWSLLRAHARSWVVGLAAFAVVGAPQMLYQLMTHYSDVPLGLFIGLGIASGGAWLTGRGERWLLLPFAAFLGMAGITKSEGFMFALVGVFSFGLTALLTRDRERIRWAAVGIGGVLAAIVPWRLYCSAYGLNTSDYDLGHLVDLSYLRAHSDRVGPVAHELLRQFLATDKWAFLTWVIVVALLAGAASASWRLLTFAVSWLVLSFGGLLMLYWVSNLPLQSHISNTSHRTIVSLLVGGASLVPLLVFAE